MVTQIDIQEIHPADPRYRLVRKLRKLRSIRGWSRFADLVAPVGRNGRFLVDNDGIFFEGDISSFIDRSIYIRGEYEQENIRLFLSCLPESKRKIILDVGANIGTHSLTFAKYFQQVHAFEPNTALFTVFRRNVELNELNNVTLHEVGLANSNAMQPFFSIPKNNQGLGTFSDNEQYDLPLAKIGSFRVVKGDEYLSSLEGGGIDAIKIDVQGYEHHVLQGLQEILRKHIPVVWFEYGSGTREKLTTLDSIKSIFPYEVELLLMATVKSGFQHYAELQNIDSTSEMPVGDYLAIPAGK